jgi:hypothetical protein
MAVPGGRMRAAPHPSAEGSSKSHQVGSAAEEELQVDGDTREKESIGDIEQLSSGTLLKRMKRWGNPGCACARDPEARHGPYYEWSYMKDGRLRHRTLSEMCGM